MAENQYGSRTYWDNRYAKDGSDVFDWLQDYEHIKEQINGCCTSKAGLVVNVGCGRSSLLADMRKDGFTNLMGVDWCEQLVAQQNAAHAEIPHKASAATDFASAEGIGEGSVDYIIDKALLDSILCGANSTQNAFMYLKECHKALKPGGKLMIISYGKPQDRLMIDKYKTIGFGPSKQDTIGKPVAAGVTPDAAGVDPSHYIYILTK